MPSPGDGAYRILLFDSQGKLAHKGLLVGSADHTDVRLEGGHHDAVVEPVGESAAAAALEVSGESPIATWHSLRLAERGPATSSQPVKSWAQPIYRSGDIPASDRPPSGDHQPRTIGRTRAFSTAIVPAERTIGAPLGQRPGDRDVSRIVTH